MSLDADDKTFRVESECESEEPKPMAELMTPTCGVLITVPTLEQQSLVMQQTAMMVPPTVVTLPQVATFFSGIVCIIFNLRCRNNSNSSSSCNKCNPSSSNSSRSTCSSSNSSRWLH